MGTSESDSRQQLMNSTFKIKDNFCSEHHVFKHVHYMRISFSGSWRKLATPSGGNAQEIMVDQLIN